MQKKPPGAPCPQRFRDAIADEHIYLVNKRYHKGITKIQNTQLDLERQETTQRLSNNSADAQWTPSSEMSDPASEASEGSASGGDKDDHGHLTLSDPIESAGKCIERIAHCEENSSTAPAPSSINNGDFLKTDKRIQDEEMSFWAN
ncbi:c5bc5eb2-131b-4bd6-91ae-da345a032cdb-CDS [Sclerotinia trifoliorum]|uniref:C5bc5eb2-131b-4bd6-91ae-da345a032cdb-CDS n=1 Tax=Sclerotinia trifoliorum TaxID=28548 RepID=A0A8H2VZY8_9HELO|nr:c5bc5eb2-131b-4bd6-91ae-da345a032cdb-CDS [Sclerotinia trifoliorum]